MENVAHAFKCMDISAPGRGNSSGDSNREKVLPPIPPGPEQSPYKLHRPAHHRSSGDNVPISLRPNVPSSTVYPPPISMPVPYTSYLTRDPLASNPLPRPPMLHPGLDSPVKPPRIPNPYAPPRRVSMPRPDVSESDISMPEAFVGPDSPSRIPWPPPSLPPPATPHRPTSNPYALGFSTPQPPKPDPVSPPKGDKDKPSRVRAASVPPADTAPDTQCSAMTKAGKRCTRQVKSGPALVYQSPGVLLDRFCFQHTKDVLQPTGFYSHAKDNTWITFAEWIPEYLHPDTQAALRAEMEKPASLADKDGYIYAYEIRNPKTPDEVHIKVGRAINLIKRLDEWGKQCGSKEVILRGWWPSIAEADGAEDSVNGSVSLMKGRIKPGEKGKYCHRLERLIHLELSDIALNSVHMSAEFTKKPSTKKTKAKTDVDTSPSKGTPVSKLVKKPCPDCNTVHKEIFTLERVTSGKLKGREWEDVVQPIIEKWGRFVSEYV